MKNGITGFFLLILHFMFIQYAFADDDLVNCKWENGVDMSEEACDDQRYWKTNSADERARIDEKRNIQMAQLKKEEAPSLLKNMSKENVCALYGQVIRNERLDFNFDFGGASDLILSEVKKRKIKVNSELVKKTTIKLGMSVCALYASWGMPIDRNKSVGSWGVHIQHVYGNSQYVYTENGIVTSWQN